MIEHNDRSAATEHAIWSRTNLVNLMTAVSKAHLDLTEQELFDRIADTMIQHLTAPAQSALEPEVVAAAQRAIMANPLYRDKFGDSPVAAFGLAYSALKVLVPQRSPAATVETKAYSDAYTQENIEILESEVRRLRNENSQLAAAITAQPPAAHPSLSAGNGDAGCGAAVIMPWADQYNACWDRSKPDALKSAAEKALNYIENTENELGIKLSCGDALREALK